MEFGACHAEGGRALSRCFGKALAICLAGAALIAHAGGIPPQVEGEAPQVRALLEQGWAVESGIGLHRNPVLAADLYRQAGRLGSGEGYYRVALIYLPPGQAPPSAVAACYLAAASQLGHQRAAERLERAAAQPSGEAGNCDDDHALPGALAAFDVEGYVGGLALPRRRVAQLIRRLAPLYAVDVRLALAVATAESNFNTLAVSPKLAMGVMQLIPATAERFGVRQPFDAEQNIRGGLAYLRWLGKYYRGDIVRVVAAYNAGEKAVDAHRGIPPYAETRAYVARVLAFAGREASNFSAHGTGK